MIGNSNYMQLRNDIFNLSKMFGQESAFGSELKCLGDNFHEGRTTYKAAQQRFRLFAKIYSSRNAKSAGTDASEKKL